MPQSIPLPQSKTSQWRVIRDEDSPRYDAGSASASIVDDVPEPVVMLPRSVGETVLGTLGPAAFGVYWHVVNRITDGRDSPSLDDIAEATTLSRKHVTRMLDKLEETGWIVRCKRSNAFGMMTSTRYEIPEKVRTNGCDMNGTEPRQGVVLNVTPLSINGTGVSVPTVVPEEKEKKIKGGAPQKSRRIPVYTEAFEAWWKTYPEGHGVKTLAFEEWKLLTPDDHQAIVEAMKLWQQSRKWRKGFIREAQRWLAYREWEQLPAKETVEAVEPHINAGGQGRWVG